MSVNLPDTASLLGERLRALEAAGPAWLVSRRRQGLAAYQTTELPKFPRTPLKGRRLDTIAFWEPGQTDAVPPSQEHLDAAVTLVNGRITGIQLPDEWASAGAEVQSLTAAASRTDSLVQEYLGRAQADHEDRYTALNLALFAEGVLIRIPRNVSLKEPLAIRHFVGPTAGGVFPRILILAEPQSRCSVVDLLIGDPTDTHRVLVSGVLEVVAQDGAEVLVSSIQELAPGAEAFLRRAGVAGRDARIVWNTAEFGAALAVSGHHCELSHPGGLMKSVTVFFGTGAQHQDYTAVVDHIAPHTRSDILARGVMANRARSVFTGDSRIRKGAVQADARQKEQTLMLSDQARADAIPSLKIDDNDVFAAHSASAGPVDPLALYYLESRGIPESQAVRLVVQGFLEPVLAQIGLPSVRDWLRQAVDRKLGWTL